MLRASAGGAVTMLTFASRRGPGLRGDDPKGPCAATWPSATVPRTMPRVRATVEPVVRLDEAEPETTEAPAADASSLLQLQQAAGNQAVVRMVRGAARTPPGRVLARKTAF